MKEIKMTNLNFADVANISKKLEEIIISGEVSGRNFGPGAIAFVISDDYTDMDTYPVKCSLISIKTTSDLLTAVEENMMKAMYLRESRNLELISAYGAHFGYYAEDILLGVCFLDVGSDTNIVNSEVAKEICLKLIELLP